MSAVSAIISTLTAAGITATLTPGGTVRLTPAARLTDELRCLIRANKPQLVDWLRAANDSSKDRVSNATHWPGDTPMTPDEVSTFTARILLFTRRWITMSCAEALAVKLMRRDREGDDRRCCMECRCLSNNRRTCTAWRKAGVGSPSLPGELIEMLQRCPAFEPAAFAAPANQSEENK